MSSLAAMTNIPQLICQLFRSFQINKNGCYEIGLNIEGEWQIILLDDYFPCSKKNRVQFLQNQMAQNYGQCY